MARHSILSLFFISVFYIACENERCGPYAVTSTWTAGKEILTTNDTIRHQVVYSIEDGDHTVFQFQIDHGHCDGAADDDYSKSLNFEIGKDISSFEIRDSLLLNTKCFVHTESTWINQDYEIHEGIIKGHQLSEHSWELNISVIYIDNLTFHHAQNIYFNGFFENK